MKLSSRHSRRGFLAACLAVPCHAAQWTGFRGQGTSRASGAGYPLEWSPEKNLAWDVQLPGYGQSSPVVHGSQVFLTALEGPYKETLSVLSLSLETGELLWRRNFSPTQRIKVSNMVSKAAPTPAADADSVYAFFETGEFLALSHAGELRWQRSLVQEYGEFQGRHGIGSSLRLTRNGVLVLAAHSGPSFLLSADRKQGRTSGEASGPTASPGARRPSAGTGTKRSFWPEAGTGSTPSAAGTVACSGTWTGWKGTGFPHRPLSRAAPSSAPARRDTTWPFASRAEDEGRPSILWRAANASTYFCSPLVYRDQAYFVNKAGVAYCLSLTSGEELWTQRLQGQNWVSPIGAGDQIYFFSMKRGTDVLRASSRFEKLAENPPLAGGRLYGVAAADAAFLIRYGDRLIKVARS